MGRKFQQQKNTFSAPQNYFVTPLAPALLDFFLCLINGERKADLRMRDD